MHWKYKLTVLISTIRILNFGCRVRMTAKDIIFCCSIFVALLSVLCNCQGWLFLIFHFFGCSILYPLSNWSTVFHLLSLKSALVCFRFSCRFQLTVVVLHRFSSSSSTSFSFSIHCEVSWVQSLSHCSIRTLRALLKKSNHKSRRSGDRQIPALHSFCPFSFPHQKLNAFLEITFKSLKKTKHFL